MSSTMRLPLGVLILGLAVIAWPADRAQADPVGTGDVYAVFATDGEFGDGEAVTYNPAESYTVLHLATYTWTSVATEEHTDLRLEFVSSPASVREDASTFAPGTEYFLIGSLQGQNPDPFFVDDDHLLISGHGEGVPPFENPLGSDLHDDLIRGTADMTGRLGMVGASTFWGEYPQADATGMQFFEFAADKAGLAPILQLSEAGLEDGGSEDLFGYGDEQFCNCITAYQPTVYDGDLTGRLRGLEAGDLRNITFTPANDKILGDPVPEPATLALLGVGLVGLGLRRRRRAA